MQHIELTVRQTQESGEISKWNTVSGLWWVCGHYVNWDCVSTIQMVLEEIQNIYEEKVSLQVKKHILFDTSLYFKCSTRERTRHCEMSLPHNGHMVSKPPAALSISPESSWACKARWRAASSCCLQDLTSHQSRFKTRPRLCGTLA